MSQKTCTVTISQKTGDRLTELVTLLKPPVIPHPPSTYRSLASMLFPHGLGSKPQRPAQVERPMLEEHLSHLADTSGKPLESARTAFVEFVNLLNEHGLDGPSYGIAATLLRSYAKFFGLERLRLPGLLLPPPHIEIIPSTNSTD